MEPEANLTFADTLEICVATFGEALVNQAADEHLMEILDDIAGTMAQLNHEGDTTYSWDRKNKAECDAAKEHFDSLRKKGFLAFKVNRMGCKQKKPTDTFESKAGKYIYTAPELATEFEPQANYVMTPQMNGG